MAKKNQPVVEEPAVEEVIPVIYDKNTPVTGEVGVVVFGNNTYLKNTVADVITRHLRHEVGMPHVERHEFHAPGRSHGIMQHEDSILDVLERANPQLMGTRVVVAVDTIGQSLISTEDARSLRRFGMESVTRTGEYNGRVKLADLVQTTEQNIAQAIALHTRKAIEATSSFTDADSQPVVVNELLKALTDGTATTDGFGLAVDYAVDNVGMLDPRLKERISFRDMTARPVPLPVRVVHTNPGTDIEIERELRAIDPGISQGVIDAYLGRGDPRIDVTGDPRKVETFQEEMAKIIKDLGGEATIVVPGLKKPVPMIGDVFDRMIRTKVEASLANQRAAEAEEACNDALEEMAETLDRIEGNDADEYVPDSSGMFVRTALDRREALLKSGVDPEVADLQMSKNLQKRAERVEHDSLDTLRRTYVEVIDTIVQDNQGIDDTLEDLYDLAKQLPEGVSVRSSGAIISNNEDGPEAKINTGNATYSRF